VSQGERRRGQYNVSETVSVVNKRDTHVKVCKAGGVSGIYYIIHGYISILPGVSPAALLSL
jgi:recombinational DNA repair protein RecR